MKKINISVICGGKSTEHEISVLSAANIIKFLDSNKYDVTLIYIDFLGQWHRVCLNSVADVPLSSAISVSTHQEPLSIHFDGEKGSWQSLVHSDRRFKVDCVFPIVHGTYGEDGALQGFLETLNLPYVGSDVQSSAICMNKDICKALLRVGGVPVLDWEVIYPSQNLEGKYEELAKKFGNTLFVKAASLGSSVGVRPVSDAAAFKIAIKDAFRFGERVIVEPRVYGKEIECAVLGNDTPEASVLSEIVVHRDYYSYATKYLDPKGATPVVPAFLPEEVSSKIRQTALQAFRIVNAAGMVRVDFFLVDNKRFFVNELNTAPGFTSISMYPAMWEASGVPCSELLDRLIQLAFNRHRNQQSLVRRYQPESL